MWLFVLLKNIWNIFARNEHRGPPRLLQADPQPSTSEEVTDESDKKVVSCAQGSCGSHSSDCLVRISELARMVERLHSAVETLKVEHEVLKSTWEATAEYVNNFDSIWSSDKTSPGPTKSGSSPLKPGSEQSGPEVEENEDDTNSVTSQDGDTSDDSTTEINEVIAKEIDIAGGESFKLESDSESHDFKDSELEARCQGNGVQKATFIWNDCPANFVQVTGSFNNWTKRIDLKHNRMGHHEGSLWLAPGTYEFKYVVDGRWVHDARAATAVDKDGNVNNILHI